MRRFYLVTDAPYHEPAKSGATAKDIADRLAKEQVLLYVFSRPEYAADYAASDWRFGPVSGAGGLWHRVERGTRAG